MLNYCLRCYRVIKIIFIQLNILLLCTVTDCLNHADILLDVCLGSHLLIQLCRSIEFICYILQDSSVVNNALVCFGFGYRAILLNFKQHSCVISLHSSYHRFHITRITNVCW